MLALVAISSATHDISCDGVYIASLSKSSRPIRRLDRHLLQRGPLHFAGRPGDPGRLPGENRWRGAGLDHHFLHPGGHDGARPVHSWALPLAPNIAAIHHNAAGIARTLKDVIIDYLKKPGIWVSILFIILFRAGEAQVQTIGPLFLREARELGGLGLSTAEVGAVYGTVGTIAFIIGSDRGRLLHVLAGPASARSCS
jgi:PAT family beta-lactamase induction signal transducer AmpG